MIRLDSMTEKEYVRFREENIQALITMFSRKMPAEAARLKAEKCQDEGLTHGVETPGYHFYSIVRNGPGDNEGEPVGGLWFGTIHPEEEDIAFLYYILIRDPFKGQGYGTRALQAMEEEVRNCHLNVIRLHVEKQNPAGLALYRKLGYTEFMDVQTGFVLEKRLKK